MTRFVDFTADVSAPPSGGDWILSFFPQRQNLLIKKQWSPRNIMSMSESKTWTSSCFPISTLFPTNMKLKII